MLCLVCVCVCAMISIDRPQDVRIDLMSCVRDWFSGVRHGIARMAVVEAWCFGFFFVAMVTDALGP